MNNMEIHSKSGRLERMNAAREVIDSALKVVERKYGTGEGDGETPKAYHNFLHTKNVLESAHKIAELAVRNKKLGEAGIELSEIAAAFHDLEQNLGPGTNEKESARASKTEMEGKGLFTAADIEKVENAIMSTVVSFEGGVMKQSATEDYLTRIITDADLSALGQPPEVYWATAQSLLKEMKKTDTPSLEDQLLWAEGQIAFLSNHQFYTDEARALFPHKEENIEFAKQKIKEIEDKISQAN